MVAGPLPSSMRVIVNTTISTRFPPSSLKGVAIVRLRQYGLYFNESWGAGAARPLRQQCRALEILIVDLAFCVCL